MSVQPTPPVTPRAAEAAVPPLSTPLQVMTEIRADAGRIQEVARPVISAYIAQEKPTRKEAEDCYDVGCGIALKWMDAAISKATEAEKTRDAQRREWEQMAAIAAAPRRGNTNSWCSLM